MIQALPCGKNFIFFFCQKICEISSFFVFDLEEPNPFETFFVWRLEENNEANSENRGEGISSRGISPSCT